MKPDETLNLLSCLPSWRRSAFPVLCALMLCGGRAEAAIRIACIGDSITYGIGASNAATMSYPVRLQQRLGSGYLVHNYGVSGTTLLKQGDFSYWGTSQFTDSQAWSPDIVIIMLGTNDSKSQNWRYQASFIPDYEQMIQTYRNLPSHPIVYLNTSPTVFNGGLAGITQAVVHDQVLPKILQVAVDTGCPVNDVNTATSDIYWNFPDGVHPNDAGADAVANAVFLGLKCTRVDLSKAFNADAFSFDAARGDGSYDAASGGASYAAELVQTACSFHNVNFKLGALTPGSRNTIDCTAQTIALPQQKCSSLWFLGSATYGDHTGTFRITYTDGTSATTSVTQKDWCSAGVTGQNVVQTLAHRHLGGGDQAITTYIFGYSLKADPTKTVASLGLPQDTDMHVLALTLVPYVGPAQPPAVRLSTGFEAGQTQPTWLDSIDGGSNVTGYFSAIQPECSPRRETAHAGASALMYSGTAGGGAANCYFKAFQVNLPVTSGTVLHYWIYPQEDNGRFVGVDFHCTDGTTLRDSGALDQNGELMHPYFGHGGGLPLNAWSEVRSDVGLWLVGKTIDKIWVAFDRSSATGQFRGYLDDIVITD